MNDPYAQGAQQALDTFGVRIAADLMGRRMSEGPMHLGAERLARVLSHEKDHFGRVGNKPSHRPLERPARWGERQSLEASASNAQTGILPYGGV